MTYQELPFIFDCRGDALLGILSLPAQTAKLGVLIIVGGPQYRAGSHRQFTLLARKLAAGGIASLRFDCRGMGDSSGAMRSFDTLDDDIAAALDAMQQQMPDLQQIVLWGLCDAASAALLYWQARHDPRIGGLCLLNPWVRSAEGHARAQIKHYYLHRLFERAFWQKLLRGEVEIAQAGREFSQKLSQLMRRKRNTGAELPSFQARMGQALGHFGGPVLLILSGRDLSADEFRDHVARHADWQYHLGRAHVEQHTLPEADHTFSCAAWRAEVENLTLSWLQRQLGAQSAAPHQASHSASPLRQAAVHGTAKH